MSEEPRNDKTCEACGDTYGSLEEPMHAHLCPYCASVIDRQTKERKEDPFNWFGDES
jgi:predicted RNA-binding Zn-ribbon protein involved in translation (DUF1610 family)